MKYKDEYIKIIRDILDSLNIKYKLLEEFKFHEKRKWRIDYYLEIYISEIPTKIAIEIEGGIWILGRHNRPKSYLADMEKYNEIAKKNIILLRYTPKQVFERNDIIKDLNDIISFQKTRLSK